MKKYINKLIIAIVALCASSAVCLTSCSDEPAPENYYTFTGEMVSDYLDNRPEMFSEFVDILHRSGMYGMMATYGTYTCLAPTNEAIDNYLHSIGKSSVDELSKKECDTLAWNHIIKYTYFTMDLHDGNFPTCNMNDRYLTFSCDSDKLNNNNVAYFVNKASRMIVRDDSVVNGVVHTIDKVIQPSSQYLPELIAENDSLADAYYNAGMAYFKKAVELDKKIQLSTKQKKMVKDYYQKSLPFLTCYRALAPEQKDKWGFILYTIYLNLNMGEEFDEIDKILRAK